MAYSRWSHSCWYAYSDVTRINDEPTLTLCDHWSLPLSEVKKRKDELLENEKNAIFKRNPNNYKGDGEPPKDRYTDEEIVELNQIIDTFIFEQENRCGLEHILEDIMKKEQS